MDIAKLAISLDGAAMNARPISQLSHSHDFDIEAAYAIQRKCAERRFSRGDEHIGVKMGFTSRAKMEQMGVSDLILGVLTASGQLENNGTAKSSNYIRPKVEPEIAFGISKRIDRELTPDELRGHVDAVCAAIEITDSRYKDFNFSLTDVIADNCSFGGLILGGWYPADTDISDLEIELSINGEIRQRGSSKAILNDPWASLQHATRLASKYGWVIEEGAVVLAGAATPSEILAAGDQIKVTAEALGDVSFMIK